MRQARAKFDVAAVVVPASGTMRDAIVAIDRNQKGIALVVDGESRLVGTLTDGDVRRATLAGKGLDWPIAELLASKAGSAYSTPVTAVEGTDHGILLQMMREAEVRQIPLVDLKGRPVDLVTIEDLVPNEPLALQAVIMAGGFGSRLMPLTEQTPKPMLPVGGRPLMEIIIDRMRRSGIRNVCITTHYQSEKITSHFGNGENHGVAVSYVDEDQPLGTAGALGLMAAPDSPLLVVNGDILTNVNFRAMLDFHRENKAEMTVAVRKYDVEVPYGVVECEVSRVRGLAEKPTFSFFVNAGIYVIEPTAHKLIPAGKPSNMTDLIQLLLDTGRPVASFPVREYWLDVGRHGDYELAQAYPHSPVI